MGKRKFEIGDIIKLKYSTPGIYQYNRTNTHVVDIIGSGNEMRYVLDLNGRNNEPLKIKGMYADLVTDNEEVIAYEESRLTTTRETDGDANLQGSSAPIPQPTT